jgi:hypothetical protein
VVTDDDRRSDTEVWAAYQEGNWEFFGAPRNARIRLHRLGRQQATEIEWEL